MISPFRPKTGSLPPGPYQQRSRPHYPADPRDVSRPRLAGKPNQPERAPALLTALVNGNVAPGSLRTTVRAPQLFTGQPIGWILSGTDHPVDTVSHLPRIAPKIEFSHPGIQAFYAKSEETGTIDYDALKPLIQEIVGYEGERLDQTITLLTHHAILSFNWTIEIADSLQRAADNKPATLESCADGILRYETWVKQGAEWNSFEKMAYALKLGQVKLEPIVEYAIPGTLHVRQALIRPLKEEVIDKLKSHKLIALLQDDLLLMEEMDTHALFLDFAEEESIPKKVFNAICLNLGVQFNFDSALLYDLAGVPVEFSENDLERILQAFAAQIGNKALANSRAAQAFQKQMSYFLIAYLEKSHPHFKEHLATLRPLLAKVKEEDDEVTTEDLSNIYKTVKELYVQGVLDYSFETLIGPAKKALESFVSDQQRTTLSEVRTWPEFRKWVHSIKPTEMGSELKRTIEVSLAGFGVFHDQLNTLLKSFGKFFSEQALDENIELRVMPVKGILAAIAIDTGSDCGKGAATHRTLMGGYTTNLITNPSATQPLGYIGYYEATADNAERLIMTDAINPSTQLQISGESFLEGVAAYYRELRKKTKVAIAAFLISKNSELVSNRTSIETAASKKNLAETNTAFFNIQDLVAESADHILDEQFAKWQEKQRALAFKMKQYKNRIIKQLKVCCPNPDENFYLTSSMPLANLTALKEAEIDWYWDNSKYQKLIKDIEDISVELDDWGNLAQSRSLDMIYVLDTLSKEFDAQRALLQIWEIGDISIEGFDLKKLLLFYRKVAANLVRAIETLTELKEENAKFNGEEESRNRPSLRQGSAAKSVVFVGME